MPLKEFDDRIRQKLTGYNPSLRMGTWEAIERKLPQPQASTWTYWLAAAATFLFTISVELSVNHSEKISNSLVSFLGQTSKKPELASNARILVGKKAQNKIEEDQKPDIRILETSRTSKSNSLSENANVRPAFGKDLMSTLPYSRNLASAPAFVADVFLTSLKSFPDLEKEALSYDNAPVPQNFYSGWKNPAFTAAQGRFSLSADDKVLLSKSDHEMYVNHFSCDFKTEDFPIAIGTYLERHVGANYIYRTAGFTAAMPIFESKDSRLNGGVGVTFNDMKVFEENLFATSQADHAFGFIYPFSAQPGTLNENNVVGADAGLYYSCNNVNIGFAVKNINQPALNHYKGGTLQRDYRISGGYQLRLPGHFDLTPWVDAQKNGLHRSLTGLI